METKETATQPAGNLTAGTNPAVINVENLHIEMSNPKGELYAPNVNQAWWKLLNLGETVIINVTVEVYLPDVSGGFDRNNITIVRQRLETDSPRFNYYVTYNAPETEPASWIQYRVSYADTIDPGDFSDNFPIEIYLQDKDPKTSRGTVTTVLPSSMADK